MTQKSIGDVQVAEKHPEYLHVVAENSGCNAKSFSISPATTTILKVCNLLHVPTWPSSQFRAEIRRNIVVASGCHIVGKCGTLTMISR